MALLAFTLSGCFVFLVVPSATQPNVIGDAAITLDICASMSGSMTCPRTGNSGNFANDGNSYQLMVGFRIPQTGVTPPTSFSSVSGIPLTFTQSPSYAAELERLQSAGSGQRWVGYISGSFTYMFAGLQTARVQPAFALAQGADGSPFKGPLMYRPVVGSRNAATGTGPGRPVSCGPNLFSEYAEGGSGPPTEICVDDPSSTDTATNLTFATEDLGILAGATGSGVQGTMATVPFSGVWSGPSDPMALFTVSASTTLPGATVGVGRPTLNPPADSTTQLPVTIATQATAAPGTYNVVITATLANGQTRTATGTLTVTAAPPPPPPPAPPPPPPPPPPDNHFTLHGAVGSAADGSVDVTLVVPGAGDIDVLGTHSLAGVALLRPGHERFAYGRATAKVTGARNVRVVLRPSRAGRRLLAGFKVRDWALHARLWVTFTPRGGFANTQMRVVRVLKHVSYIRSR